MSVFRPKSTAMLLAPAVIAIAVFMALPLLLALAVSFMTADTYGGAHAPLTFSAYVQLLFEADFDGTWAFSPSYLQIFARSILLAVATTLATLVIALPVAWHIVCQKPEFRNLLLFAVTLPFDGNPATFGNGTMATIGAKDRDQVAALHAAALANGGSDEGAPGLRDNGHFVAYWRDPDGNKMNAVALS